MSREARASSRATVAQRVLRSGRPLHLFHDHLPGDPKPTLRWQGRPAASGARSGVQMAPVSDHTVTLPVYGKGLGSLASAAGPLTLRRAACRIRAHGSVKGRAGACIVNTIICGPSSAERLPAAILNVAFLCLANRGEADRRDTFLGA